MNQGNRSAPVAYIATLDDVSDVSLWGTADPGFWEERLKPMGLKLRVEPTEQAAQVVISAMRGSFAAVTFRELCVALVVDREDRPPGDPDFGLSLVQAYHSFRPFAIVERVWFRTPYEHANIRVQFGLNSYIKLSRGSELCFEATMRSILNRTVWASGDERWEGPVYLPGKSQPGCYFPALLCGETERSRFDPRNDSLTIADPPEIPAVFRALKESGFVGKEWAVRLRGRHARGRTYSRTLPGGWSS